MNRLFFTAFNDAIICHRMPLLILVHPDWLLSTADPRLLRARTPSKEKERKTSSIITTRRSPSLNSITLCCNFGAGLYLLRAAVVSTDDDANWWREIHRTGWIGHIASILSAALRAACYVKQRQYSVLVHCSDGWDRTAQVVSLAQILIDPYYRTMEGFAVLIEKDWIGFGHKFKDRLGFLDCVWQLTEQFPDKFQFNERFLKHISTHCQTNWFSTFICNSDKERKERMMTMKAANTSGSGSEINKYTSARELPIWSLLLANRAIYSNPRLLTDMGRYNQEREMNPEKLKKMLLPIPSVKVLQIWTGMYLKYDESLIGSALTAQRKEYDHVGT
eukprot:jgi/Bigna1/82439/fgenesh1_pg.92_\